MMGALRIAVAAAALATMASAALTISGLSPAPSPLRAFGPQMAAGEDRRAELALKQGGEDAFAQAVAASRSALRVTPYDTAALLRIAYIDQQEDGRLDAEGLAALAESYRRVPIDRSVALWRIRFCLENWDRLPAEIRLAVQNEVFGAASEPGHLWPLRIRLTHVANDQGRVVAILWHLRIARSMEREKTGRVRRPATNDRGV